MQDHQSFSPSLTEAHPTARVYICQSFISKTKRQFPFLHIWKYTANKCFQAFVTIIRKHSKKLNMVNDSADDITANVEVTQVDWNRI